MPEARIKFQDGMRFSAITGSGHEVMMDSSQEFGGQDTAARPMELLLAGLGGCTGMDVISILRKKKQEVTSFEIIVKGNRAEDHPKRYTGIEVEFVIKGNNLSEEAVKRAVELSMDKYCSVRATLEGSTPVKYHYKIG